MNFNQYLDLSPLENETFDLSVFTDDKFKFIEFGDVFEDTKKLDSSIAANDALLLDLLASSCPSSPEDASPVDQSLIQDLLDSNTLLDNVACVPEPISEPVSEPVSKSISQTSDSATKASKLPLSIQDRRKRNTIASVKFRNKKKLLQQQMEKELADLRSQAEEMKNNVLKLELENKYLKGLLAAKNEQNSNQLLASIRQNASISS